jgi:hypothetical protein
MRRTITNLVEQVENQVHSSQYNIHHVGSVAEGFRMSTSDEDIMIASTGNLVVNNTSEIPELSDVKLNTPVWIMEPLYPKPGYVRLILETYK